MSADFQPLAGGYERLADAVGGRCVAIACRKHDPLHVPPSTLTVRFNQDSLRADIHAVNFYADAHSPAVSEADLVIGTVPPAHIRRPELKIDKDFPHDIGLFPVVRPPVEFIDQDDWIALAISMPVFPLSGLVVLAMLQTTDLRSCEIHDMDFYAKDETLPVKANGQRGKHRLPAARAWLTALLQSDPRFRWLSAPQ